MSSGFSCYGSKSLGFADGAGNSLPRLAGYLLLRMRVMQVIGHDGITDISYNRTGCIDASPIEASP